MSRYDDHELTPKRSTKAVKGMPYDDYFDNDACGRIEVDAVMNLLNATARYRDGMTTSMATLKEWLNCSTEFAMAWKDFTDAGGVNADDFKSFMAGTFRYRRVRRKKHLRLVANVKIQRIKLRR